MKLQLLFAAFSLGLALVDGIPGSIIKKKESNVRRLGADANVRVHHNLADFRKIMNQNSVEYAPEYFTEFLNGEKTRRLRRGINEVGSFDINVGSLWKNNTIDGSSFVGVYKKENLNIEFLNFKDNMLSRGFAFKITKFSLLNFDEPDKPDENTPVPYAKIPDDTTNTIIIVGNQKFSLAKLIKKAEDGFVGFTSRKGFEKVAFDMRTDRGPAFEFKFDEFFVSQEYAWEPTPVLEPTPVSEPTPVLEPTPVSEPSPSSEISMYPTEYYTDEPTPTLAPTDTKFPTLEPTPAPATAMELIQQILLTSVELFFALDWAAAYDRLQEAYQMFMDFLNSEEYEGFTSTVTDFFSGFIGGGGESDGGEN